MTLLICGAGQYGAVAKEIAEAMNMFDSIIFLDDQSRDAIGKFQDIGKVHYDVAVVAVGNPNIRGKLLERISKTTTLIHPMAIVMPSAKIGGGSIVEPGAVICSNAELGEGTIVMANAVVGHNAKIGRCSQLKYNCTVSENSVVQECSKVECNVVYS